MEQTADKIAVKPKTGQDLIDEIRRGFLGALYEDGQRTRYVRRRIVESLLGVISAARASGFTWDELADICRNHGLEIAASTLKTYYLDLREEREHQRVKHEATTITKDVRHHRLEREFAKGNLANESIKKRAAQRLASRPKLMTADEIQEVSEIPFQEKRSVTTNRPLSESRTKKQYAIESAGRSTATVSAAPPEPDQPRSKHPPLAPGQAKHIDQLAEEARSVKTATQIYETLELKPDGRVYTTSGEPFIGALSSRQVQVLRAAKTYIANAAPDARSTKSVVKMPSKL